MYKICKTHPKEMFDTKDDPHITFFQIQMTPLGPGLLSQANILFNCPIRGIMPIISRTPVGVNNDEKHYKSLGSRQTKDDKNQGTARNYVSFPQGLL